MAHHRVARVTGGEAPVVTMAAMMQHRSTGG
jgi:hypothetical protein